jgi:glycosyltransferase involved in cell wall biosynthesis
MVPDMRVLQLSHAFNHLIIAELHRSLAANGAGLLAIGDPGLLNAAMPGAVRLLPPLRDPSATGQRASVAPVRQLLADWQPDAVVYHEPPVQDSTLLRFLAGRLPVAAFIHNIICPGSKLLRRHDRLCRQPLGWSCLRTWYAGPCGSNKSPAVAFRQVRDSLRRADALRRLPLVLVAGESMRRHLLFEGFAAERVRAVDPGYRWDAAPLRSPCDPRNPRRLLFVGRLAYNKGVQNLLRAMARADAGALELTIVGDGYYRAALERLAAELRLPHVHFTGWLDQPAIADYYQSADLLVVPSLWPEPYGAVIAEAAAFGLPALVSDRGALPEWRGRLPDLRVVDVTDVAAFARALQAPAPSAAPSGAAALDGRAHSAPSIADVLADAFGRGALAALPVRDRR